MPSKSVKHTLNRLDSGTQSRLDLTLPDQYSRRPQARPSRSSSSCFPESASPSGSWNYPIARRSDRHRREILIHPHRRLHDRQGVSHLSEYWYRILRYGSLIPHATVLVSVSDVRFNFMQPGHHRRRAQRRFPLCSTIFTCCFPVNARASSSYPFRRNARRQPPCA